MLHSKFDVPTKAKKDIKLKGREVPAGGALCRMYQKYVHILISPIKKPPLLRYIFKKADKR